AGLQLLRAPRQLRLPLLALGRRARVPLARRRQPLLGLPRALPQVGDGGRGLVELPLPGAVRLDHGGERRGGGRALQRLAGRPHVRLLGAERGELLLSLAALALQPRQLRERLQLVLRPAQLRADRLELALEVAHPRPQLGLALPRDVLVLVVAAGPCRVQLGPDLLLLGHRQLAHALDGVGAQQRLDDLAALGVVAAEELVERALGQQHRPDEAVVVEAHRARQRPLVLADAVGLGQREPAPALGQPLELRRRGDARPAAAQRAGGPVLAAAGLELDDDRELALAGREDVLVEVLPQPRRLPVEGPRQGVEHGALAAAGRSGDREEVAGEAREVDLVLAAEAAEVLDAEPARPHAASSSDSTLAKSSSNLRITSSSSSPPWASRQKASKFSRRPRAAASRATPSTGALGTSTWTIRALGSSRLTRSRTVGSCRSSLTTSFRWPLNRRSSSWRASSSARVTCSWRSSRPQRRGTAATVRAGTPGRSSTTWARFSSPASPKSSCTRLPQYRARSSGYPHTACGVCTWPIATYETDSGTWSGSMT